MILPPIICHSRPVSLYGVNSSGNPEKTMNLDSASLASLCEAGQASAE